MSSNTFINYSLIDFLHVNQITYIYLKMQIIPKSLQFKSCSFLLTFKWFEPVTLKLHPLVTFPAAFYHRCCLFPFEVINHNLMTVTTALNLHFPWLLLFK